MHTPFDAQIKQAAEACELDPILVQAIVVKESNGDPWASRFEPAYFTNSVVLMAAKRWSQKHNGIPTEKTEIAHRSMSYGLVQLMGQVARENGFASRFLTALYDPATNLEWGCRILAARAKRAHSPEHLMFMWNAGPGAGLPHAENVYVAAVKRFMADTPYA